MLIDALIQHILFCCSSHGARKHQAPAMPACCGANSCTLSPRAGVLRIQSEMQSVHREAPGANVTSTNIGYAGLLNVCQQPRNQTTSWSSGGRCRQDTQGISIQMTWDHNRLVSVRIATTGIRKQTMPMVLKTQDLPPGAVQQNM